MGFYLDSMDYDLPRQFKEVYKYLEMKIKAKNVSKHLNLKVKIGE